MNADIRVSVSFRGHRKRKKLQRKLGAEAVLCLIDLWIVAAMNKPDGVLSGMDAEDIAIDAGWDGDPQTFVDVLVDVGFVDIEDGCYVLHDWDDHNSYVAKAENRKKASRNAADARWHTKRGMEKDSGNAPVIGTESEKEEEHSEKQKGQCTPHADNEKGQCALRQSALPTHGNGNGPVPVPVPVPKEKDLKALCNRDPPKPGQGSAPGGAAQARRNFHQDLFERFWDAFADKRSKQPAWNAWRKIKGLDKQLAETIIAGARFYAQQRADILARKGTPKMAEGWLNDRRWEDEGVVVPGSGPTMSAEAAAAFARLEV